MSAEPATPVHPQRGRSLSYVLVLAAVVMISLLAFLVWVGYRDAI